MSNVPLSQRVKEFGLTEVFSHPEPQVDVVLVHGLNGNPYTTWATHKPEVFWPADLLPAALSEQRCRILTYGYDANVTAFTDGASKDKIHNHAENLASRLVANRNLKKARERPIIFICHSLGGLVVKRCLIYSKASRHVNLETTRSIYVSTYGVLFLGTPHNGSDLAKWGSLLERISSAMLPKKFLDSSGQLVEALKSNNETLQNINRLFTEIMDRFHIFFFHEGKPMDLKGSRGFVVEETSAAPEMQGVERSVIERDHSHMCKFEDENAPGYDVVAEAIMRYADDAPNLIKARWEEEKHIREVEKKEIATEILRGTGSTLGTPDLTNSTNSAQQSQAHSMVNSTSSLKPIDAEVAAVTQGPRLVTPLGFRPNTLFMGFEHELEDLHIKLHNRRRRELGTCSVLVWGEVGCGKTHLTRQYFFKHRTDFPAGSFWVDCRSKETILNGFWDIGTSIGSLESRRKAISPPATEDHITAVREGLAQLTGWLLVFDGLAFESEEELDAFKRFVPDRSGNGIIITSVDRSLAKRQRLLNPAAVKVHPLSPNEACELLYKSLSIRKPSTAQQAKALELVKDCQRLPLAIHATAHALIEKGKQLERYSHAITDIRLTTPFLEILSAFREKNHHSAWNLAILLSFFNHYVPVALIHYARNSLRNFRGEEVEILTPINPEGARKDLDSTVAVLMRSGLLERTVQAYPVCSSGSQSPEESRTQALITNGAKTLPTNGVSRIPENEAPLRTPEDSGGLELVLARLDSSTDRSSISSNTSTIDVLRMHVVVQTVVRDHLKDRKPSNNKDYWWWLTAAVHLLAVSFSVASEKMKRSAIPGLVRDYREYEIQATRLWSFFPRSSENASRPIRKSRHELHELLRSLKREIQTQSPSQSSDSSRRRYHGSIFERSSSTSEGDPDTPTSDLTRASTWSFEPDRPPSESPTAMNSRQNTYYDIEGAVESDNESWPSHSDSTEVPDARSRRSSALRAIFEGRPQLSKKDLGEWKPALALPFVSQSTIQVPPSRSASVASTEIRLHRPSSAGSEAEAALFAISKASPPAAGRVRSTSRGSLDRPVSATRSTSSQLSPLASEFQPSDVVGSKAGSSSRSHSRTSSSPRLMQAALVNQAKAARPDLPPLHFEQIGPVYPPSASSRNAQHQYILTPREPSTIRYRPTGYTSVPMSRFASKENGPTESDHRYHNDHPQSSDLLRTFSDPQLHVPRPQTHPYSSDASSGMPIARSFEPKQNLAFGRVDEWMNFDPSPTTPVFPTFDYSLAEGVGGEEVVMNDTSGVEAGRLTFGGMDSFKVQEARQRADMMRERSAERGRSRGLGIDISNRQKDKGELEDKRKENAYEDGRQR